MNEQTKIVERDNPLDAFAKTPEIINSSLVPAGVFSAPAERVFGAQLVAVRRDESDILGKIKKIAAAAGDDFYYRFPVRKKNEDGTFATDYIEGPSIKCANNVARIFGNCDTDVRVFDLGDSYMFYARFMDLETGYSLVRPFRQRKGQKVMKTDAGRQEDIVFQIGASKAIRNVTCNALEYFTSFAMEEAKNSIIEKVGKKLDHYKDRVAMRLEDLKIDIKRVEIVRGRALKDWLAGDVARTIAELQAIQDGMATTDETYPLPGAKPEDPEKHNPETGELDQFANGKPKSDSEASPPPPTPAAQPTAPDSPPKEQSGAGAAPNGTAQPTSEAGYIAECLVWFANALSADDIERRWKGEKALRRRLNITSEVFDDLERKMKLRAAELRASKQ